MLNLVVEFIERISCLVSQNSQVTFQVIELPVYACGIVFLFSIRLLEHYWEESLTHRCRNLCLFACVETALQHKQVRNREEDLSIAALDLLFKLLVLLTRALNQLTEANQLFSLVSRHKVRPAKAPCLLKPGYQVHQLRIVPQLRIDNLDVLSIPVHEQVLQVVVAPLYVQAQLSDSLTLTSADLTTGLFGHNKD